MSAAVKFRQLLVLARVASRSGLCIKNHASFSQRLLQPAASTVLVDRRPLTTQSAAAVAPNRSSEDLGRGDGPSQRPRRSVVGNNASRRPHDRSLGTDLERALTKIDIDVKRLGRVSFPDFAARMEDLKSAEKIPSQTALLMIRCCGNLLVELKPEDRIKLTDELWKRLEAVGTRLDISHYNALLKVHLENAHKFDPTAFLKLLEQKGVEPNRVTYQRLIAFYCQQGDIAGATQILEFMRTKDFPINESVFNVLVQGYARSGDMDNAVGILDMMRSSQLEPSSATYKELLDAFAEKGDIAGLEKYVVDAEKNGVQLGDAEFLGLIHTFASKNHHDHVPAMFERLRKSAGYFHDALNTTLRLLDVGADEAGFRLLSTLAPPKDIEDRSGFGTLFMRKLIRYDYPVEKIVDYARQLRDSGLNTFALERACEAAFHAEKPDVAIELIRNLRDSGKEIRAHYFWPLFCVHRRNKDVKAVWETIMVMTEMGVQATLETMTEYVLPCFKDSTPNEIINEFQLRFPSISVVNPLAVHYLENGKIKEATRLLQEHDIRVNPIITMKPLAEGYLRAESFADTEALLRHLNRRTNDAAPVDFSGQFLLNVVSQSSMDEAVILKALNDLAKARFKISAEVGNQLDARFRGKTPEKIASVLDQLVSRDSGFRGSGSDETEFGKHPRDMSLEELEEHLLELKSKGMNTRGVLRRLLVEYARMRDVKRAEEIKAELDASKSDYSGAMHAQLMDMYVQVGDLDKALATMKSAENIDSQFIVDAYKILNLAALMISKDRAKEALEVLERYSAARGRPVDMDALERNIFRVLNAAAEKGDVELVRQTWDTVQKLGNFVPTNLTCGPLVKVHIVMNDIPGAVKAFQECVTSYQQSPWKGELMKRLIEAEDTASLQTIMDLGTQVHGEANSLFDLAFSFIEAGRIKQAQKIFDTPGLRARQDRLEAFCNRMLENNRPKEIEGLLTATRDLFDIDRDVIFYHLIRMYGKMGQPDQALAVWTNMQEENVQASVRTLRALASILREHKVEVPFEVPEEVQTRDESSSPEEVQLLRAIRDDDPDRALEHKRQMDSKNHPVSVRGYSHLIEILLQKDRIKEAVNLTNEMLEQGNHPFPAVSKFLLNKLSRAGEVDILEELIPRFPEKIATFLRLQNHSFLSYVNSNRSEEVLARFEQGVSTEPIPINGLIQLLRSSPNLLPRVQVLAERYAAQNDYRPALAVWTHMFMEGHYDDAKRLLEKYPGMSERLRAVPICERAHETNDMGMLRKLIDTLREHSRPNVALAYSYLIGLQCHNRDYPGGLEVLKEAQEVGGLGLQEFRLTALRVLERGLTEMGLPVPFKVPDVDRSSNQSRSGEQPVEGDDEDRGRMRQ